jgi:glucosamine 6-phosphate synthetase-like amidotransferase/phosphosugar isomerase protein
MSLASCCGFFGSIAFTTTGSKMWVISSKPGIMLSGTPSIFHTRWATHGGVTDENAHPHKAGKVAVVHNGIIENYRELRDRLEERHIFSSETDTEVITHLVEEEMEKHLPLEKAIYEATKHLKGSYALLAICSTEPGKIVELPYKWERKDGTTPSGITANISSLKLP